MPRNFFLFDATHGVTWISTDLSAFITFFDMPTFFSPSPPPSPRFSALQVEPPLSNKAASPSITEPSPPPSPSSISSPASTLIQLQRRFAQQEVNLRLSSQGTIMHLLPLCDERQLSRGACVIGVEEMSESGKKFISLHTDELLSESLHETEIGEITHKVRNGKFSAEEKMALLTDILQARQGHENSPSFKRLQSAIENFSDNPEELEDEDVFLGVLQETKAAIRLEDIQDKYKPPEGSIAEETIKEAMADLRDRPEVFHDDEHFDELLETIRDDIWERGSRPAVEELQRLLQNTLQTYKPRPSSVAHTKITAMLDQLANQPNADLDAAELQKTVRDIAEDLHKSIYALNPHLPTRAVTERSAPFMPTESMKQWMTALEQTIKNSDDDQQQQYCTTLLEDAKNRFLRHELTFKDMREYFLRVAEEASQHGIETLGKLATSLYKKTPGATHDNFDINKDDIAHKTLLHDNRNARTFESGWAEEMVKHPTEGMRESMRILGTALCEMIMPTGETLTDADKDYIDALQNKAKGDPYSSVMKKIPLFDEFIHAADAESAASALHRLLNGPKENGLECIVVPYLVTLAVNAAPPERDLAWNSAALQHYRSAVEPRRARISTSKNIAEKINSDAIRLLRTQKIDKEKSQEMQKKAAKVMKESLRNSVKTTHGGIGMLHQPPAISDISDSLLLTAAIDFKPDFAHGPEKHDGVSNIVATDPGLINKLPKSLQNSLSHGIPFVGDLSGVTHRLMYMADAENKKGNHIDIRDVLITTTAFLCYIGAHSMHECFFIGNMLDGEGEGKLKLGLELGESSDPDQFISDYTWLHRGKDGAHMKAATDKGLRKMIDQA